MSSHIVDGEFQSDKYPTTPRGKVPLSIRDPTAQDLLWEYAQRRREVDAEFSADLETALRSAGYVHHEGSSFTERERELLTDCLNGARSALKMAERLSMGAPDKREFMIKHSTDCIALFEMLLKVP
jgi:hypothetical protein